MKKRLYTANPTEPFVTYPLKTEEITRNRQNTSAPIFPFINGLCDISEPGGWKTGAFTITYVKRKSLLRNNTQPAQKGFCNFKIFRHEKS